MQNKFVEEFEKATNGEFGMLKFNSATFTKDKNLLQVRFIISAFDIRSFGAEQQQKVLDVVKNMFNGVDVEVQYIRTYADESTVRNKILEFFNLKNQMVFRRLREENIAVSVSDRNLSVLLRFDPPTYKMLSAAKTEEELTTFLDTNYNLDVDVTMQESDSLSTDDEGDISIDTVVLRDPNMRLVKIDLGEKVYARGKVAGLSQLPNYITDVKSAAENIVLCGKIFNLSTRMYKNKKYNPDDPKSGPEELPLVRFFLDDTTGKIECVCFPRPEEAEKIQNLAERTEVACAGKVSLSNFTGNLSLAVNALFLCTIDYSSINTVTSKPEPAKYSVIKPQPYTETAIKKSLFDESTDADEVSPYFRDKTFVIFDFEATGLQISAIEPIEIGAAKVVNGKITETFSSLLNPKMSIPAEVAETTHITDDMVADKPTFKEVLPDFFKFTRGAVLVGHNISGYDYPLLAKYADAEGYVFDNEMEDTLILARKYLTEVRHCGLEALSRAFNISHDNAHRAMADVFATVEVLRIIAKRM